MSQINVLVSDADASIDQNDHMRAKLMIIIDDKLGKCRRAGSSHLPLLGFVVDVLFH